LSAVLGAHADRDGFAATRGSCLERKKEKEAEASLQIGLRR
jgi:hypothetical protein